jgi:hypothetical protein
MMRRKPWRWLILSVAIVTGGVLGATATAANARPAAPASYGPSSVKSQACIKGPLMCTEVQDNNAAFGYHYVGHDEPSVLYYSPTATSGR